MILIKLSYFTYLPSKCLRNLIPGLRKIKVPKCIISSLLKPRWGQPGRHFHYVFIFSFVTFNKNLCALQKLENFDCKQWLLKVLLLLHLLLVTLHLILINTTAFSIHHVFIRGGIHIHIAAQNLVPTFYCQNTHPLWKRQTLNMRYLSETQTL